MTSAGFCGNVCDEIQDITEVAHTKHVLSEREVVAIEQILNKSKPTEAIVKIEKGEIVVFQSEKKKIV